MNVYDYLKHKYDGPKDDTIRTKLMNLHKTKTEDTYFSIKEGIKKLIDDYKLYGNIIIAYDFDDTVKPSELNNRCDAVVNLLQICSELEFTMICYTARRTTNDIDDVKKVLDDLDIRHDYINEDSYHIKKQIGDGDYAHKIIYSVFLDNRAGLYSAYQILIGFLDWYLSQNVNDLNNHFDEGGDL